VRYLTLIVTQKSFLISISLCVTCINPSRFSSVRWTLVLIWLSAWQHLLVEIVYTTKYYPQKQPCLLISRFDPRQRRKDFASILLSRPALWTIQRLIQFVPGVLSPRVKRGPFLTLTTHPHLLPRSRMIRIYTSSPQALSTLDIKVPQYLKECMRAAKEHIRGLRIENSWHRMQ
jgi:hypothetical protein